MALGLQVSPQGGTAFSLWARWDLQGLPGQGPGASGTDVPSLCLRFCSLGPLHPHKVRPPTGPQDKGRLLPSPILMNNHDSCHLLSMSSMCRAPCFIYIVPNPYDSHQGIVQRKKSRLGDGNLLAQGHMPINGSVAMLCCQS